MAERKVIILERNYDCDNGEIKYESMKVFENRINKACDGWKIVSISLDKLVATLIVEK